MAALAEGAQCLCRAAVKPSAAQDVALVVDHLAHERVCELETLRRGGRPQESGTQNLVERRLGDVRLEACGRLQCMSVVLEAEDRGGGDQLVRVVAHPRQPDADGVPDALRHHLRTGLG